LKPADETLLPYERLLLDGLFETGETVEMSDLKNKFYDDLARVKTALYDQAETDKLFPRSPSSTRTRYFGAGIAIAFLGILAMIGFGFIGAGILGVPLILAGGLLSLLSGAMPRRTGLGRELFRRSLGFREYMEVAETDRQRFYEQENIFAEYLPYAIVFGCTEKWAKAFEGLQNVPSTQSWYVGSTPGFHSMAFVSSVNSFSNSMSSAIASTPSSSGRSGFGSGGFSGGGMGGGGTSSW
jgi:hypothetical protein